MLTYDPVANTSVGLLGPPIIGGGVTGGRLHPDASLATDDDHGAGHTLRRPSRVSSEFHIHGVVDTHLVSTEKVTAAISLTPSVA